MPADHESIVEAETISNDDDEVEAEGEETVDLTESVRIEINSIVVVQQERDQSPFLTAVSLDDSDV